MGVGGENFSSLTTTPWSSHTNQSWRCGQNQPNKSLKRDVERKKEEAGGKCPVWNSKYGYLGEGGKNFKKPPKMEEKRPSWGIILLSCSGIPCLNRYPYNQS